MRFAAAAMLFALTSCWWGVGDTQPRMCADYVSCSQKLGDAVDLATYGASGSCWVTQASVNQCEADCTGFNNNLKASGRAADAGCTFSN